MVTSFNPYFVGKIARAFSLVRFESSKKLANFVFVKTSNGHNFCSGYQNRNYYICIWGRKKFPMLWQPFVGRLRSPSSKNCDSVKSFLFSKYYSLIFCLKFFVLSSHHFIRLLTKFQVIWISFEGSCSSNLHLYLHDKATSCVHAECSV